MESYAPLTDVLRTLVRADVFKWEEKHQEAFEALKNALSADTVLAYFDPAADHEVHVDKGHQQQPDLTAVSGPRRSARARTST